jgi:PAS domain S-box-containing protein
MSQSGSREISFSDTGPGDFGSALRALMTRPTHVITPGWLSKTSGIPKATIINWLKGRVAKPSTEKSLRILCDALRLQSDETAVLYEAAGIAPPPLSDADTIFDKVPVGLYITTPAGRVVHVNRTLMTMLGYTSRQKYLELDVARDLYVSPDQRRRWLAKIDRSGTVRRYPVWAKRADGSPLLVLDSAMAIRDSVGEAARFEGVWELPSLYAEPVES